jgi:hypothetical protein
VDVHKTGAGAKGLRRWDDLKDSTIIGRLRSRSQSFYQKKTGRMSPRVPNAAPGSGIDGPNCQRSGQLPPRFAAGRAQSCAFPMVLNLLKPGEDVRPVCGEMNALADLDGNRVENVDLDGEDTGGSGLGEPGAVAAWTLRLLSDSGPS